MAQVLISGSLAIRPMTFEHGVVDGHAHTFDHTTYIVRGAVLIEQLDDAGEVVRAVTKRATDGQNWVLILAGVKHRLTPLEPDALGHCIYSHRDPETGDVVTAYNGWDGAYV